ncbi:hypothetical protein B7R54_01730 [Subtercola boreus]|uniref:Uncharacterized protein n=1 Tax=Subtercola boreus TaxID=120213 RepID=A0A3E0VEK6_9MICO|nr:hypothetical protein B7R54_01730 [Subtercola boreus]TQL55042.1 hypothetical protein FB464_2597 [Subtercola boreus]
MNGVPTEDPLFVHLFPDIRRADFRDFRFYYLACQRAAMELTFMQTTSAEILSAIYNSILVCEDVEEGLAENPNTPNVVLYMLRYSRSSLVRETVLSRLPY